jgi:hypothetical protein
LYGPAVARAYELESEFAQFPRIVVSQQAVKFLEAHRDNPEKDRISQYNRILAETCLGMLLHDVDGLVILHYLGKEFQKHFGSNYFDLYTKAHQFIVEQLREHRLSRNSKLAFRYSHLALYFDGYPPTGE